MADLVCSKQILWDADNVDGILGCLADGLEEDFPKKIIVFNS